MKRQIFIACLADTFNTAKRRFLWYDESKNVSILHYNRKGRYVGRNIMSASDAREYWKLLIRQGFTIKMKKTPAERIRGIAVRNEINRIIAGRIF